MPTDATEPGTTNTGRSFFAHELPLYGVVLVYSRAQPWRVGEVALFSLNEPTCVGRNETEIPGTAVFARHIPGQPLPTHAPSLLGSSIGRKHLMFVAKPDGLMMEVVAGDKSCRTLVNGAQVTSACLKPGDVIHLYGEAVFVVVQRPRILPSYAHLHPFGEADAYGLVGESLAMWNLRVALAQAAKIGDHVLLLGRTGTGKDLAARVIHALSQRANGPFKLFNSAGTEETLLLNKLFGNLKNFPNPGMIAHLGALREAEKGILFLDEIGELPLTIQAGLLIPTNNGIFRVAGEDADRIADLLFVGATNRDINDRKIFREDFPPRFKTKVYLPSLSQRPEDIALLITHLVRHRAAQKGQADLARFLVEAPDGKLYPRVSGSLVAKWTRHPFEKNVRELDEMLSALLQVAGATELRLPESKGSVVPPPVSAATPVPVVPEPPVAEPAATPAPSWSRKKAVPSKEELAAAIEEEGRNVAALSKRFGVQRGTMYGWLKLRGLFWEDG